MAAPLLRRASVRPAAAATWTRLLGAGVPAARAFVCRVIAAGDATSVINMSVGAASGAGLFADGVALGQGQTYTEQGIVVAAGEDIWVYTSVANGAYFSAFGEEVDN